MGGKLGTRAGAARKRRAGRIAALLDRRYRDAGIALRFSNPLELMVATILSAQCTDVRVNEVTPELFAKYRRASDYAEADPETLMGEIRSTGFYRNKSGSIIAAARRIAERHGGQVPATMEELVAMPGIGRKTANVILGNAFGVPGVVVDTHVQRVSRRLGLTENKDPVKIEYDLMRLFPRAGWTKLSHQLIAHGRRVCRAPKPRCRECFFDDELCPGRRSFL